MILSHLTPHGMMGLGWTIESEMPGIIPSYLTTARTLGVGGGGNGTMDSLISQWTPKGNTGPPSCCFKMAGTKTLDGSGVESISLPPGMLHSIHGLLHSIHGLLHRVETASAGRSQYFFFNVVGQFSRKGRDQ